MPLIKTPFTLMIILIMLMIESSSWLIMWITMEMANLMFMSMLLNSQNNKNFSKVPIMLIIQFLSSSLILISFNIKCSIPLELGISMKMGLFPFHNWIPMMMVNLKWFICFTLMTIQKIPPILFMVNLENNDMKIMFFLITITPITIALKLLDQTNIKIIMGMSSIIHSNWMILSSLLKIKMWLTYTLIYMINMYLTCLLVMKFKNSYLSWMTMNNSFTMTASKMLLTMALVGMPPLPMIVPKMIMMMYMKKILIPPMMSLLTSTTISIIFYSRLFESQFLKTPKIKMKLFKSMPNTSNIIMLMITLSLFMLIL